MQPSFAYFGHHKCGSTWITRVLTKVLGHLGLSVLNQNHDLVMPKPGALDSIRKNYALLCWNSDWVYARLLECPGFHVIRDPRDVVVSGYFSHLDTHSEDKWPRLHYYRNLLRGQSKEEGLVSEMSFSAGFLYAMYSWDYTQPRNLELRFEDLIADPRARFSAALDHLGIGETAMPRARLARILSASSFEVLSGGRRPGEEASHHFRRGVPGDWRNHFSTPHIDLFKRLYNPLLLKTGYERDEDWH
jgi:hypothetical protein